MPKMNRINVWETTAFMKYQEKEGNEGRKGVLIWS